MEVEICFMALAALGASGFKPHVELRVWVIGLL